MNRRYLKHIALFLVVCLLNQVCFPMVVYALTTGPGQPEMDGFEPASTNNMVDLFTGDFTYNIPLFDLEGYPVNLSYHSGIGMEEEASWVGLGWSLNPGTVTRDMRGLPDDFAGEAITREFNLKDNITVGLNVGASAELISLPLIKEGFGLNAGLFYNNYKGFGFEVGAAPSLGIGKVLSDKNSRPISVGASFGYNSQSGVDIGLSAGFAKEIKERWRSDLSVNGGINSREGLKDLNFSISGKKPTDKRNTLTYLAGGLSFGETAITPVPEMPIRNASVSVNITAGTELVPLHPNLRFGGYYVSQFLASKSISQPAFGYLNSTYGGTSVFGNNDKNLLDFNKEALGVPYTTRMKRLPVAYGTYDLFTVSGQGTAGQFRAKRSDVGVFRDALTQNRSVGVRGGAEVGAGNIFHAGTDFNVPISNSKGGAWKDDNPFQSNAQFTDVKSDVLQAGGASLYEPVYFKDAGELTPADVNYYQLLGEDAPSYVNLSKTGTKIRTVNELVQEKNQSKTGSKVYDPSVTIQRSARDKRNQVFSYLNGVEALRFGLDRKIYSYPKNTLTIAGCGAGRTEFSRLDQPGNHISEVSITQVGGSRYVYGIPAYNLHQKEATFSVNAVAGATSLIPYVHGSDNSINNNKGRDNYYDAKIIPSYATSYLLTGVLSPDYVDFTGNGISDDDAGTAVKFNYTKSNGKYKWRSPSNPPSGGFSQARYNPGMKSDLRDDKGSYVYGEKELWFMHSIESKNFVAQFYTSDRQDALGVSEDGSIDLSGPRQQKLDRIDIYAKNELVANPSAPTPIKSVYFVYETTQNAVLCPGVPNHITTGGNKLTLKEVYFTYGKNTRGSLNKYKFAYASPNTAYNAENVDRWGTYKMPLPNYPNNSDYPYTYQDSTTNQGYASAWNLNKITLPTGGVIDVTYESDDYAYVMDKRAGQHIFVKGFSNVNNATLVGTSFNLYNSPTDTAYYMYLNLPYPVSNVAEFQKRYLADVDKLFFNCSINLTGTPLNPPTEYIQGYAEFYRHDIVLRDQPLGGKYQTAVIRLKPIQGDRNAWLNPITKAAMQTLRLSLPDLTYSSKQPLGSTPLKTVRNMVPFLREMGDLIIGFDKSRMDLGWGQKVNCDNRSWVRLSNPNLKKYGGGTRVKKVVINDTWGTMVSGNGHVNADYGQEYFYSTREKVNGRDTTISSGVASYEPGIGNDENLCRRPVSYTNKKHFLGPRHLMYQEDPIGEALYPAPSVGYSRVMVRNLTRNNVKRTATGYSIYQFYTAKDFPTISSSTALHTQNDRGSALKRILKLFSKDNLTMSQGFTVEVNDMHGKPKTEETYNEGGGLLASTEYRYKTDAPPGKAARLKNEVDMVKPDGTISTGSLGVEMDVWQEMSQEETTAQNFGVATGLDGGFLGIFPTGFPGVIPIVQQEKKLLRTSITTKFIKRFGILERVIKTENGSSLTTDNLLYDSETGDPLLTRLQNEFDEPVYKFNYPAHWAYDNMGQAYKTQDAIYSNVNIVAGGIVNFPNIGSFLKHGDQVSVSLANGKRSPTLKAYHISNINNKYVLMDASGAVPTSFNGTVRLRVMRPVRRNMASASIGAFESLGNPRSGSSLSISTATKVLNATANTFNDSWQIPCNFKQLNCSDQLPTSSADIQMLINKLCDKDTLWWVKPSQNVTVCSVIDRSPCTGLFNDQQISGQTFFSLTTKPRNGKVTVYEAQVGHCKLTIFDPVNGSAFKPESIVYGTGCPDYLLTADGLPLTYALECSYCTEQACNTSYNAANSTVNPFTVGVSGNWRPLNAFVFDDKNTRNYSSGTINQQGYYASFSPFWTYSAGSWIGGPGSPAVWVRSNTMTKYDRAGNELENTDALYKYSAALFGFKNQKPLATSSNCRYQQIAYEGFEEKSVAPPDCINACQDGHSPYTLSGSGAIATGKAHTGKASVLLNGTDQLKFNITKTTPTGAYLTAAANDTWTLNANACNGTFQPMGTTAQDYVVSAWVYMDQYVCNSTGSHPAIQYSYVTPGGTTTSSPLNPSGPSIEGWRKIEFTVQIPANATSLEIKCYLPAGTGQAWFDDIRVHPFNGSMRSFAYDPYSLRLMAELDERNYATFYEYDDAGLLVRVKRETERGVMTIQEGRTYLAPN